jgi:hypothetical protein
MNNQEIGNNKIFRHHRPRGAKILRIIGATILGVTLAVAFAFIFGFIVKLLWNWLMPVIFNLPEISYWQAFGLVILAKLLFSGLGHKHGDHQNRHFHDKINKKWHRFIGVDDEEGTTKPPDFPKDWKMYEQYWQDEGRNAFEAYIQRFKDQK